jgi:hypothetical protein
VRGADADEARGGPVVGHGLDPGDGTAVRASSELHIAEDWYRGTALDDLLGIPSERVNEDRLYRGLDRLLPHKQAIETHLQKRLGELFALEYDLLLYDVTSTYFEGLAAGNSQAQRGHSRDHRPDCKQVCIALVVTRGGSRSATRFSTATGWTSLPWKRS